MCGIAGILQLSPLEALSSAIGQMLCAQEHRGPDGEGTSVEHVHGVAVALGHRRLSIIDLSTDAGQPMHSSCGRYTLIFNGEVYNYREIRAELERLGRKFRTHSDSEVILQALIEWGPPAFDRFNGMWGIAFLDRVTGELCLSRDRFGVKPVYLFHEGGRLIFASEIKAILAVAGRKFAVDAETAYRYLAYNSLDVTERTFFAGITKLPQGHYQICHLRPTGPTLAPPVRYWDFTPEDPALYRDEDALASHLRELLQDAVSLRLRSDVPLGLLLSGGVDSSCIAALMMRLAGGTTTPTALAMVSDVAEFSEERFIDIVTRDVGIPTRKVRLQGEPAEALRLLSEVTYHNDEPVGTFSNIAQYLLMAEARKAGITVILSGQGADEILCGYRKYTGFYAQSLVRQGRLLKAAALLQGFRRNGTVVTQFHLADAKRYLPRWLHRSAPPPFGPVVRAGAVRQAMGLGAGTLNDRQRADLYEFSIPMLTHYEDRMSMAHGRETRLPFLDYRVVNLLVQAPPELKLAHGWTKYILRKALAPLVPAEIIWRKDKQGFLNPERTWLANELRPRLTELFRSDMLAYQAGLLDRPQLTALYEDYCAHWQSHGRYSAKDVFYPLALELWLRRFESHLAV